MAFTPSPIINELLMTMYLIVFLAGLALGSFLNVVIDRIENLKTIVAGRSYCNHCHRQLGWYDLIPIVSFLWLKGYCRYCKKPISWQYPAVELITGFLLALIVWQFGLSLPSLLLILLSLLLIPLFAIDLKTMLVPDILSYPAVLIALLYGLSSFRFFDIIWGLLIGAGLLGAIVLIGRGKWMGTGDIVLGGILGLAVGYPLIIFSLPLSFVLGAIVSLVLLALKLKTLKDPIPFGPFLILSLYLTIFFQNFIF